tara:strand:+ start:110 stop:997 length:888 start_codon:yes stop_codon:yes gene_type:complete
MRYGVYPSSRSPAARHSAHHIIRIVSPLTHLLPSSHFLLPSPRITPQEQGGELVYAGTGSWSTAGRTSKAGATAGKDGVEAENLMGFVTFGALTGVRITTIVTGCVSSHIVALAADGRSFIWGRNEQSQLGMGHHTNVYNPTPFTVSASDKVTGGATGSAHTLLTTESGTLYACGKNDYGQCGVGRISPEVSKWAVVPIGGVTQAAAGRSHSLLLTATRETYAFGCPECVLQYCCTSARVVVCLARSLARARIWLYFPPRLLPLRRSLTPLPSSSSRLSPTTHTHTQIRPARQRN